MFKKSKHRLYYVSEHRRDGAFTYEIKDLGN